MESEFCLRLAKEYQSHSPAPRDSTDNRSAVKSSLEGNNNADMNMSKSDLDPANNGNQAVEDRVESGTVTALNTPLLGTKNVFADIQTEKSIQSGPFDPMRDIHGSVIDEKMSTLGGPRPTNFITSHSERSSVTPLIDTFDPSLDASSDPVTSDLSIVNAVELSAQQEISKDESTRSKSTQNSSSQKHVRDTNLLKRLFIKNDMYRKIHDKKTIKNRVLTLKKKLENIDVKSLFEESNLLKFSLTPMEYVNQLPLPLRSCEDPVFNHNVCKNDSRSDSEKNIDTKRESHLMVGRNDSMLSDKLRDERFIACLSLPIVFNYERMLLLDEFSISMNQSKDYIAPSLIYTMNNEMQQFSSITTTRHGTLADCSFPASNQNLVSNIEKKLNEKGPETVNLERPFLSIEKRRSHRLTESNRNDSDGASKLTEKKPAVKVNLKDDAVSKSKHMIEQRNLPILDHKGSTSNEIKLTKRKSLDSDILDSSLVRRKKSKADIPWNLRAAAEQDIVPITPSEKKTKHQSLKVRLNVPKDLNVQLKENVIKDALKPSKVVIMMKTPEDGEKIITTPTSLNKDIKQGSAKNTNPTGNSSKSVENIDSKDNSSLKEKNESEELFKEYYAFFSKRYMLKFSNVEPSKCLSNLRSRFDELNNESKRKLLSTVRVDNNLYQRFLAYRLPLDLNQEEAISPTFEIDLRKEWDIHPSTKKSSLVESMRKYYLALNPGYKLDSTIVDLESDDPEKPLYIGTFDDDAFFLFYYKFFVPRIQKRSPELEQTQIVNQLKERWSKLMDSEKIVITAVLNNIL